MDVGYFDNIMYINHIDIDESGIKLIATDSSHNVLIHMKLLAENFDYYHCNKRHVIGVNMTNMYKLIKTMGNSDILTLFLEQNNE